MTLFRKDAIPVSPDGGIEIPERQRGATIEVRGNPAPDPAEAPEPEPTPEPAPAEDAAAIGDIAVSVGGERLLPEESASEAEARTLGTVRARELGLDYRWNVFPQPVRAAIED